MVFEPETGANPIILDRPEARKHVKDSFSDLLNTIQDLVDYGSHLLLRCWATSDKQLTDVIILPVLLKQCIELADAFSELVREGCIDPAQLQLRALFEASVYIDWILLRDTKKRARAYYVSNLRKRISWGNRLIPGKDENRRFKSSMNSLKTKPQPISKEMIAEARKDTAFVENILKKRPFYKMNLAFNNRKRGKLDPIWYRVMFRRKKQRGVSLRTLCQHVKRLPEYQAIYESTSETMHSSRSDAHVRFHDGKLHIKSLRNLERIGTFSHLLFSELFYTYNAVLKHYRPGEIPQLKRTYRNRWRKTYRTQYRVDYSYVEKTV